MRFWLILNVDGCGALDIDIDCFIDKKSRPSYLHATKEGAENEILRLAKEVGGTFLLFESVAVTSNVYFNGGLVGRLETIEG